MLVVSGFVRGLWLVGRCRVVRGVGTDRLIVVYRLVLVRGRVRWSVVVLCQNVKSITSSATL